MVKYNYTKAGNIEYLDRHSESSFTSGEYIAGTDKFNELIEYGAEIAPYIEPVKTLDDIRFERDSLLAKYVDIYNPLRWAELTTEQKDSIKKYRQALLDITKQDPASVIWPELPLV